MQQKLLGAIDKNKTWVYSSCMCTVRAYLKIVDLLLYPVHETLILGVLCCCFLHLLLFTLQFRFAVLQLHVCLLGGCLGLGDASFGVCGGRAMSIATSFCPFMKLDFIHLLWFSLSSKAYQQTNSWTSGYKEEENQVQRQQKEGNCWRLESELLPSKPLKCCLHLCKQYLHKGI